MHDLCEGTIKVLLTSFFELGMTNKIFSEDQFKILIKNYNFGVLNSQFIPSDVKLTRKNLNQSASQMKCLMQHIPYIFFAFKNNPSLESAWACINSMLKILRISYSSTITESDINDLETFVESHLKTIQLCFAIKLIPKHHFMTHYAEIIRRSGPLCHMSTLRYEMKHKGLTNTMKNNNNFKNVTQAMTNKFLHNNLYNEVFIDQIDHKKLRKADKNIFMQYQSLIQFFENPSLDSSTIQSTKNVRFNSDFYESGLMLKNNADYLEIIHILYIEKFLYFICKKYFRIAFDDFLMSVEIKPSIPEEYLLIKHSELEFSKTYDKKILGEKIFILSDSLNIK